MGLLRLGQRFSVTEYLATRGDNFELKKAKSHGMGLARMPCYIGDTDPSLRRLDLDLTPSTWGIWILSHIDLRSTARGRTTTNRLKRIQRKALLL
jgi:hypothetical protein